MTFLEFGSVTLENQELPIEVVDSFHVLDGLFHLLVLGNLGHFEEWFEKWVFQNCNCHFFLSFCNQLQFFIYSIIILNVNSDIFELLTKSLDKHLFENGVGVKLRVVGHCSRVYMVFQHRVEGAIWLVNVLNFLNCEIWLANVLNWLNCEIICRFNTAHIKN